jgi:hypothetical protein
MLVLTLVLGSLNHLMLILRYPFTRSYALQLQKLADIAAIQNDILCGGSP